MPGLFVVLVWTAPVLGTLAPGVFLDQNILARPLFRRQYADLLPHSYSERHHGR